MDRCRQPSQSGTYLPTYEDSEMDLRPDSLNAGMPLRRKWNSRPPYGQSRETRQWEKNNINTQQPTTL